ncbi:hypothetical protein [Belliella pelovolcani]|uniref:DUF3108 domain-containing protein n=1 Tax=Belliella pelovolcani TaxID=529505 RepID=A0A1N7NW95_9BACT|nr:hypothetical protein [Belliella pelovolcani]SIT02597.1 hypothetical protein SAMN05421761_11226 [Belliella pelovolcani]
MDIKLTCLLLALMLSISLAIGQTGKQGYNYTEGTVTLKNGKVISGEVANVKHGFRDQFLESVRVKPSGKGPVKKYKPHKISGYTMGERQFVSWRVKRNNALLKEMYAIDAGRNYKIFEVQLAGQLSIYLDYFVDDDLQIHTAPFFLKENDLVMVRATQGMFGLKRQLLSTYFFDCPPLVKLIQEKRINTVEEVARYYNHYHEQWAGGLENYSFWENNGVTTVIVELYTVEEYMDYFTTTYPTALEKLKEISEG